MPILSNIQCMNRVSIVAKQVNVFAKQGNVSAKQGNTASPAGNQRLERTIVMLVTLCLLLVSVRTSASGAQGTTGQLLDPAKLQPGTNEVFVRDGPELRRLIVILPSNHDHYESYPTLFCFHGAGGKAENQSQRWASHVEDRGLVLVSFEAVQSLGKWNFKEDFHPVNHDDVALVRRVARSLVSGGVADSKAMYATGHSSGGLFCYRLVRETSLFAAVCPMSCGMAKDAHDPDRNTQPVHLMQVIGDRDKSYHGSTNPKVTMHSADKRMKIWRDFYHCHKPPVIKAHGIELAVQTYTNEDGIELAICEAKGQGHHLRRDLRDRADRIALDFMLSHRKK